jgi:hypothetical protein
MDDQLRYLRLRNINAGLAAIYLFALILEMNVATSQHAEVHFWATIASLLFGLCLGLAIWQVIYASGKLRSLATKSNQNTEDRLDELERLKRRGLVTTEEYAAKRQEILKDL